MFYTEHNPSASVSGYTRGITAIYFDHNATTPLRPAARAAKMAALDSVGNPSSVHESGRKARRIVDAARAAIARAIGLPEGGSVVFTSGGTEANHLALLGTTARRILVSAVEHDSVRAAVADAGAIPVDADGIVNLAALEALLTGDGAPALVSVMAANNETGVLQPVAEIAALAHRYGAIFHCDAVQWIGRLSFDMTGLGVDLATVSAHKLGGAQGSGALALAPEILLTTRFAGGGQERGLRAGTENVAGIAGFGAAADEAARDYGNWEIVAALRDRLEAEIARIEPAARFHGAGAVRLPNTSCIGMPGVASEIQVMGFDLAGICVSAGSACSSGKVKASHVLAAMGVEAGASRQAIRVSLGQDTTAVEIDKFLEVWQALSRRARR